jgi:hypothetical protein
VGEQAQHFGRHHHQRWSAEALDVENLMGQINGLVDVTGGRR